MEIAKVEPGQTFFEVALDGRQIVGFSQIALTPQGARLMRIYLLPAYIGRGVGRTLLQHGEAWLKAQGIAEYGCYVHAAKETGKRFYERQQFVHQPEHDQPDEWYMYKKLEP